MRDGRNARPVNRSPGPKPGAKERIMKFKGISIEKAENVLSVRDSDTFGLVRGRLDALDAVLTKMSYRRL